MFGKKLVLAELKELRGVVDDLRREIAFLRGQLSVKQVPYQSEPRANTAATGAGVPGVRVTFWPQTRNWDGFGRPNAKGVHISDGDGVSGNPTMDDDEAAGPVPARV